MATYTTEIASDSLVSDNPIHQRLLQAYYLAVPYISGDLLEIGCGEGRGVELLAPRASRYMAIDKIQEVIDRLAAKYPDVEFVQAHIPPISQVADNSFDVIVSFQVIEHIRDDKAYLEEIYRILKPGGRAIITTPNIKKTLSRNPWHEREYTAEELRTLCAGIFDTVTCKGVTGNEKVWEYYQANKKSVERITRFDIFNLQYRLPAPILRIPYDILNRFNRNRLNTANTGLVAEIKNTDYLISDQPNESLDLFYILEKAG